MVKPLDPRTPGEQEAFLVGYMQAITDINRGGMIEALNFIRDMAHERLGIELPEVGEETSE
jgi:hypothetical protein